MNYLRWLVWAICSSLVTRWRFVSWPPGRCLHNEQLCVGVSLALPDQPLDAHLVATVSLTAAPSPDLSSELVGNSSPPSSDPMPRRYSSGHRGTPTFHAQFVP